jgi:hypothetical protein
MAVMAPKRHPHLADCFAEEVCTHCGVALWPDPESECHVDADDDIQCPAAPMSTLYGSLIPGVHQV